MKKTGRVIVIAIVCVAVLVGIFWKVNKSREASVEDTVNLTEVQKVITKDFDKNYPETPREVVKNYNRIISCFFGEEYTDEELEKLGNQARKLLDDELLESNPINTYFNTLKTEINDYKEHSKTIVSTTVADSNDVKYQKVDGDECAYVKASYFVSENKKYSRTYQMYVLRKDEQGKWKILAFYQTEGDTSEDE